MTLPKAKVNSYERRIARLKAHIELLHESKVKLLDEQARVRLHYQGVVAKHLANERRGDQLLLEDRFKIQELDHQVAVQCKNLAEAKDDANVAKLNQQVLQKQLERCRNELHSLKRKNYDQEQCILNAEAEVRELKRSLTNRFCKAIATQGARLRVAIARQMRALPESFRARFAVWRLNSERIKALDDAQYALPEKLVKAALAYWEHDKKRLDLDEEIRTIHHGTRSNTEQQYEKIVRWRKPGLWRRLMITLGRV